jgi:hypothetical protein
MRIVKGDKTMSPIRAAGISAIALCIMLFSFSFRMSAQVKTETTTTPGAATHQVSVDRGEVVHISGNDLVVKMEDGSLRDFENVPESARVTVDGKELGIHELKPGMKLERTITVTTTPQTVTTTKRVTGRVWHVSPPTSVILQLEDGTTQQFTIPKGQQFVINGQETDAWGLKKGMTVSATKVTEEPVTVVEHRHEITGTTPPPPAPPAADVPILIAVVAPMPKLAQAAPERSKELPKTGSVVPLTGLGAALALWGSFALRTRRRMG